MTQIETRMVQTGEYKSYIMEGGDPANDTIIFLHGSGPGASGKSNWQYILPSLAENFHVIAPDMYGFGNTEHPETPPNNGMDWLRARIDQVINLMDEMKIEKTHLVGNSLGGVISLHVNMQAPERFEKIVLLGAGGGKFEPTVELMKLQNFHRDASPTTLRNLLRWFLHDYKSFERQLDQIVEERLQLFNRPDVRKSYEATFTNAPISDLAVPPSALEIMESEFLLVHGNGDRFVPLESSLYMMDYLPNAQLHIFNRCGHWVQVEQRERFIKLTRDFFLGEL